MAIKISELTAATSIAGTEVLPIVQSATTKKVTAEFLNTKPVFEINLTSADYNVTQYGIYYITAGTDIGDPHGIILPNPSEFIGTELLFFNYDQALSAGFSGDYIPYLEASTSTGDKYDTIINRQAVKIVSINGYWAALNYKL